MENRFLNYQKEIDGEKNWALEETEFQEQNLGKFETIFSLGNGYLGLRATTEENYANRHYGLFVGGTFSTPPGDEVPELPNGADILNMEFIINGQKMTLNNGVVDNYSKFLNIKNGLLTRSFVWSCTEKPIKLSFTFETFTSFKNIHSINQQVKIKNLSNDLNLNFVGGIDTQTTNSGTQHFTDYDTRFWNQSVQQYVLQTNNKITFFYNRLFNFYLNNQKLTNTNNALLSVYGYDRRKVYQDFEFELKNNEELTIEAFSTVYTTRDFDFQKKDYETLLTDYAINLKNYASKRFSNNFQEHEPIFQEKMAQSGLEIESQNDLDVLLVRLANYQLHKLTPWYDKRLNIDAKGWVGEEYKGHTFWDTEIYILPFYIYNNPQKARELLEHRYFVKPSAHIKAKANNVKGAMWPWETSWKNDGETCPTWGEVDFKTGKRMKVWAAFNELHISADIMWAIDLYFKQTNDVQFMEKYGYEMLFDTALFWSTKAVIGKTGKYEILQVTGPNEYKENIDNNIFTNYMVAKTLNQTLGYYNFLKNNKPQLLNKIQKKINLTKQDWKLVEKVAHNLYLPNKNDNGIYPENDTFLTLKEIENMPFYKKNKGELWKKYTANEINDYQILKQADIVALFYTMLEEFKPKDIINNWKYYEARTLHSSSLSLSMHAVTACLIGELDLSYDFFQKALLVDYGPNMTSSTNGIHSAAIGGIIKCVVEGFGGIKNTNGLIINPHLPKVISKIGYNFYYLKNKFHLVVTPHEITLRRLNNISDVAIRVANQNYLIKKNDNELVVKLPRIKGFVFDLDGVITKTADLHFVAWQKMAQQLGINIPDEMEIQLRGVERTKCLDLILDKYAPEITLTQEQKEKWLSYKNAIYVNSLSTLTKANILPNMLENLEYLKSNNYKIALASVSENAPRIIDKLGITHFFDYIVEIKKITKPKPDPELFETAAQQLGLNKNEVIIVDDSITGIQAIKNGNMLSIGIGLEGDFSFPTTQEFKPQEIENIVRNIYHEEV
ncbi:putative glycosyl hydrolase [Entomoplasma freundtii]|uniref:Maltose phosphorylase n=1 Tax=Entomoplasma freundtii TaxID=74700 RepID=A0A2K8NVF3_9MOLU|nr:beta-phosphoglucomutase [Entomoplasma freundtii]ATZ16613.1 maltose phosphorylase [Entomoplasma freundtii]TDY58220.1 putative glycosyl hydrolase [Entomoplasma freundtii]